MDRLKLHYDLLKGEFSLKELNFLFVFQVNCPGCFMYGIPMVNRLYARFKGEVAFLGLSTAFEDFSYNSRTNTLKLIHESTLAGATKAQLGDVYDSELDFPVAMDCFADASFDYQSAAEALCLGHPGYAGWEKRHRNELKGRVLEYLKSSEQLSLTFTLNQLRGTPSFVVFNDRKEILFSAFGHLSFPEMEARLQQLIRDDLLTG